MKFKFFVNNLKFRNFSTLVKSTPNIDIKMKLHKLKSYLEVFNSLGIEKDLDLNDLKIFFSLFADCRNLVENEFFFKESFKEKINSIVKLNKSIEKNNDLTKHLFQNLQFEKNDYIFKGLMANIFTLIKKTDEDNLTIQYLPYFCLNLKSVNPGIILKSELLLSTIQILTKELNSNENYKGFGSEYLSSYFNIFPKIGVNVTDSDSFKFHSKVIFNDKLSDLKNLSLNDTIGYFHFYRNFRNECKLLSFRDKLDINQIFKEKFRKSFFKPSSQEFNKKEETEKNLIVTNLHTLDNYNFNRTLPIELRYDEIYDILNFYKDDQNMIKLCELILHSKLFYYICSVNTLIDILQIYLNHIPMNKTILHFIAYNSIEHLNNRVTKYSFEKDFVLLYGVICNFSHLAPNSETIKEFFEEYKSTLFHNRFINIFEKDMGALSNRSLLEIRNFHNNLKETYYFDKSFAKYLDNTINLSNQIVSILL